MTDDDAPQNDPANEPRAASATIVPETSEGFPLQAGAFGLLLVVLVGGAIALLLSLAGGDDEPDRVATDSAVTTPPVTFDASIAVTPTTIRDLSITDEPIVIDADGNIVDPDGGNNGEALPSEVAGDAANDVGELDVPDDAYTGTPADDDTTTSDADAPVAIEPDDGDDGVNLLGGDDPEDKRMPDLICRGLQAAQDEIQDRGVFGSKSEDATGQGRRQLWDRNWVVVAQDPEPGQKIGEFEAILYVVKKSDDENICD